MKKFLEKNKNIIIILLLIWVFFSFSIILLYDSAHYLKYVEIFKGHISISNWDIVRGPLFPLLLLISNVLFSKSVQGFLIMLFLFFLGTIYITNKLLNILLNKNKYKKVLIPILLVVLLFNPMIFGYYHVILTEFVSITLSLLSIYFAYQYLNAKNKKKYIAFFIIATPLAWLIKQPYVACVLLPFIASSILLIIKERKLKVLGYSALIVGVSFITMLVFNLTWNKFLEKNNVDMNTGRDSSSLLSKQILQSSIYRKDETFDFHSYRNNGLLSDKEKELIKNNNKENIVVYNIVDNNTA